MAGQKRWIWSDEEKMSICAQTCAPGVSVAQVARRYAMDTDLIHKWLRDPQFAPDLEIVEDEVVERSCFLRVEISERPQTKPLPTGVGRICDLLFEVLKYAVFGDGTVGC